jgi:hypothetical protein
VLRAQDQKLLLIPKTPTCQWAGRTTNKNIFKDLKKKLRDRKRGWAKELPELLWAYCTNRRTPTEHTPFGLVFGMEVVIPVEIGLKSFFRVENDNPEDVGTTLT